MSFINKFFKKKNEENQNVGEQILGCGRDMGKFSIDISEGLLFTAGSGVFPVRLTQSEHSAWKMLRSSKSLREWEQKCLEQKIVTSIEQLESIKKELEKGKLYLDWASIDINNPILNEFTVTNNGRFIGFSNETQKWIVASVVPKDKGVAMTDEQYLMWKSATGVMRMKDVIHEFMRTSGFGKSEAFTLFKEYAQRYSKAGLWCIEYCGEDEALYANMTRKNLTFQESWFKYDQLAENSKLLAVGEEWTNTPLDKTKMERAVIIGTDKKSLEPEELLIWATCKNGTKSLAEIAAFYNQDISQIKEIVTGLIQKRALIVWPDSWKGTEEHLVSIKPTGIGVGSKDGANFTLADLTNGQIQKIPLPPYVVWVLAHSCMPLSVVVDNFQQIFQRPRQEAEKQVSEWVPYLVERGLAHIQVIPEKINR